MERLNPADRYKLRRHEDDDDDDDEGEGEDDGQDANRDPAEAPTEAPAGAADERSHSPSKKKRSLQDSFEGDAVAATAGGKGRKLKAKNNNLRDSIKRQISALFDYLTEFAVHFLLLLELAGCKEEMLQAQRQSRGRRQKQALTCQPRNTKESRTCSHFD